MHSKESTSATTLFTEYNTSRNIIKIRKNEKPDHRNRIDREKGNKLNIFQINAMSYM